MASTDRCRPDRNVPEHLPRRLTITMPLWRWLTDRQPSEEYVDLDSCFAELVARGYNTARVDAMLNWAYDQDGHVRGPVEVGRVVEPGSCSNSSGLMGLGGSRVRALDELLAFFHLVEKHDVYVILTSWEYQPGHTTTFVADKALRDEINGIAPDEKLMAHARKYDLLLTRIKQEGLSHRIAFVEIHNELSVLTQFFGGPEATKRHVEDALAYLQARHPDLLFSGDYVIPGRDDFSFDLNAVRDAAAQFAGNTQVVDYHMYANGVQGELGRRAGLWCVPVDFADPGFDLDGYMDDLERNNTFLRSFLRPDAVPWREFKRNFKVDSSWMPVVYFYENMDTDLYDYWMFRHFHGFEDRMLGYWKNIIQYMGQLGRDRGVPVVCDEGYVWYPPAKSEFEPVSAVGRRWLEFVVGHMIEQEHWGIMVSASAVPGEGLWERHAEWLREMNDRIMA